MTTSLIAAIRRVNRMIALLVGLVLTGCVILIIVDILLREAGISFGGADEISGYVMAGVASWGMSYALTELAHVRIDLIRLRLRRRGKAMLDLLVIIALAGMDLVCGVFKRSGSFDIGPSCQIQAGGSRRACRGPY